MLPKCNNTIELVRLNEDPIYHGHTFHLIAMWISGAFAIVAIVLSLLQILLHANHYSRPYEQKHIIRVLWMVPVYAIVSYVSVRWYTKSVYFSVIRDCYEAFAIASFFSLMCAYTAPTLRDQKEYFRQIVPKPWLFPLSAFRFCCGNERKGPWRTPRSGLTWFNIIWTGVFQYCLTKVILTLSALVSEATGRYCIESLKPVFSHIWIIVFQTLFVTVAMICLIQFYYQVKQDISRHKPLIKVVAIKLIVFLSFWQTMLLSLLTGKHVIKASKKTQEPDLRVGLPAWLLCMEMALFAILNFWAFPVTPYKIDSNRLEVTPGADVPMQYYGGPLGVKALVEAINPWDMIKAVGRGARWVVKGRKDRFNDVSYDVAMGRKVTNESSAEDLLKNGAKVTAASMAPPSHIKYQPMNARS